MAEPFASPSSLGQLKSQHGIAKSSRTTMTVMGVIWALMLCTDIGVSISVFFTSFQETNNPLSAAILPFFCIGIFVLPGAILIYQQWWVGVLAVAFYDLGFALRTRMGIMEVRWRDVEAMWLEWGRSGNSRYSTATNMTYAFRLKSGESFRLRNNLEGFNEFKEKFYIPVSVAIQQNQTDDMRNGKRVMIYGIGIDSSGLTYGKKTILWSEMEALRAEKTQLMIKQNGQWKMWESVGFNIPEEVLTLAKNFIRIE